MPKNTEFPYSSILPLTVPSSSVATVSLDASRGSDKPVTRETLCKPATKTVGIFMLAIREVEMMGWQLSLAATWIYQKISSTCHIGHACGGGINQVPRIPPLRA
jgi:hypothetical protein